MTLDETNSPFDISVVLLLWELLFIASVEGVLVGFPGRFFLRIIREVELIDRLCPVRPGGPVGDGVLTPIRLLWNLENEETDPGKD